jgi:hypothetical protein
MPVSYSIDEKILRITHRGHGNFSDIVLSLGVAFHDPLFVSNMNVLIDVSEAKGKETLGTVTNLVEFFGSNRERLGPKRAIVARDTLYYGFARMVLAYAETIGLVFALFTSLEEAEQWF